MLPIAASSTQHLQNIIPSLSPVTKWISKQLDSCINAASDWIYHLKTRPCNCTLRHRKHQPITGMGWKSYNCKAHKCLVARTLCKIQARLIALDALRPETSQNAQFDTDSALLRIDNCTTACISNRIEDFEGPLTPMRHKIQGIGNVMRAKQKGTFIFSLENDEGKVHKFRIPNSYYAHKQSAGSFHHNTWYKSYETSVLTHMGHGVQHIMTRLFFLGHRTDINEQSYWTRRMAMLVPYTQPLDSPDLMHSVQGVLLKQIWFPMMQALYQMMSLITPQVTVNRAASQSPKMLVQNLHLLEMKSTSGWMAQQ